ncbi:unnamed protein product, partial [Mesorhabditis belari]|uniref:C2H2-type domain-containing protein n=1 Tax=Mesorhabditis belari TaxID=2138241 RepID=A0AAF3FEK5_9BILA
MMRRAEPPPIKEKHLNEEDEEEEEELKEDLDDEGVIEEIDEEIIDEDIEMDEEEEEIELMRSEGMVDVLEEKIRRDYALKSLAGITLSSRKCAGESPNNTTTDEDYSSTSSVDGHRSNEGSLSPPSGSQLSSSGSFSSGKSKSTPNSNPLRQPHEKKHKCETCGKAFSYLSILESHKRSHTGEKPFNCRFCDKKFAQKATLQVHERTHTGERPYKCKFCCKTFAQYGTKTVHEKSAHLGIRNYKCPMCEKNLSSPSALYTHKKTHGEKVFQCGFCPKTFTLKNYLKLHVKQVHEQNERKHVCVHCGKSFAYAGSLQVHIRTHTGERPYICKFCPKAFASQGNLQSHERTHTGERPYGCKMCERTFIQKSQLTAHEVTHTSPTPPTSKKSSFIGSPTQTLERDCPACAKRFAYGSNLCPFCGMTCPPLPSLQIQHRPLAGEKPYKCAGCGKGYAQKIGLRPHWEQCEQYQALGRDSSESPINVETDSDGTMEESPMKGKDSIPNIYSSVYDPSSFTLPVIPQSPLKLPIGLPRPLPLQIPPSNYGPISASKPPFSAECSLGDPFPFSTRSLQSATAQLADALAAALPNTPSSTIAPSLPGSMPHTPTMPSLDPSLLASLLGGQSTIPQLQLLLQLQQSQTEALVQQLLLGSLPSPLLTMAPLGLNLGSLSGNAGALLSSLPAPTPVKPDAAVAASALLQLSAQPQILS